MQDEHLAGILPRQGEQSPLKFICLILQKITSNFLHFLQKITPKKWKIPYNGYMEREIEQNLINWKNDEGRLPLVLRGARQVGKTYIVEHFGQQHFQNVVTINFELRPDYAACFESLDPTVIVNLLRSLTAQPIHPGETLLFLDEIQDCPRAIMALRYFKENMPELHVIAAGSLLEFALESEDFRMPVGRVQYLYMYPLTFSGYLKALGNHHLDHQISSSTLQNPIPEVLHKELLKKLKEYMILGGMPAVLNRWLSTRDFSLCQDIQLALLADFRSDFGKYAPKVKHKYLQKIFDRAPYLVAKHFKYSKVDHESQPRDLKYAISLLQQAGVLRQVFATSGSGLPLSAQANEKKFKLLLLDVGLLTCAGRLDAEILLASDLTTLNAGAVCEQFVGQELVAHHRRTSQEQLFFWEREKMGSTSEVDYVIQLYGKIFPIEVKSGAHGRLKSLRQFLKEKDSPFGIRISQNPLSFEKQILSIPLYMIKELPRIVEHCIKQ